MDIILLANRFNAFGVFFGPTAHAYISLSMSLSLSCK